jgi:hypothetical protein
MVYKGLKSKNWTSETESGECNPLILNKEHLTHNQRVGGSSPSGPTKHFDLNCI